MFGLGGQEILILLILGGMLAGVACLVVILVTRGDGSRVAELEAENRRLRDELDRRREQN
jgi:hypothetical protein